MKTERLLVTPAELGQMLKVPIEVVEGHIAQGMPVKSGRGHETRIDLAEAVRWLASRAEIREEKPALSYRPAYFR